MSIEAAMSRRKRRNSSELIPAARHDGKNAMGGLSLVHWIVILFVITLLFGAGRIAPVMGEFAKGMKAFRQGLKDDEKPVEPPLID
jgi:sec-independent protein translocase protein TatA